MDGKEYGYVNDDSNYEIKVKEAADGNTLVSTIDANLQSITENKIAEFNNAMKDGQNEGAKNIGVIMMNPNTGEVLAMATNRTYSFRIPGIWIRYVTFPQMRAQRRFIRQNV